MSATDELRRMLDERGEYYKTSGNRTWWGRPIDVQTGKPINVFHNQAQPMGEDRLFVELQLATPEQAIAATLGAWTCRLDGYTDAAFRVVQAPDETDFIDYAEVCECTACGANVIVPHEYERVSCGRDELWPTYNYCPHCGAKVIAPTTNNIDVEAGE